MTEPLERDHIEDLKRRLYVRGSNPPKRPRTKLSPRYEKIKTVWEEKGLTDQVARYSAPRFLTKLLLFSFIFFLSVLAFAGFNWLSGGNVVSNRNIDLVLKAQTVAKAGDVIDLQIIISNRNPVALEEAKLLITYPEGSKAPLDLLVSNRVRYDLTEIRQGETTNKNTQVILFGREGTEKEIKVTLEYRVPGSNAFYEKTEVIKFVINSPPISLNIKTLPEVIAGQDMVLEVKALSNAEAVLEDIILNVSYPFGYKFIEANEEPVIGQNVWRLGNLKPGEEKTIRLVGMIDGQDQEIKTFKLALGSEELLGNGQIKDLYNEQIETITVRRPFITAELVVNGKTLPESVSRSGDLVRVDIEWINNLPTAVVNTDIEVSIEGDAVDRSSVSPGRGFYRSGDSVIIWNKTHEPDLAEIAPGETGKTSFSFSLNDDGSVQGGSWRNPEIKLGLVIKGTRVSEGFRGEIVKSESNHVIKLKSDLQLAVKAVRSLGPFENSGPMPPKVDNETTYTLIWSIANSSNVVKDVQVKSILPASVRFVGLISPTDELVSYNQSTGEVVWRLPRVEPGIGSMNGVREVAFQVGFTPSANQAGDIPNLTGTISLSGTDDFTNASLTASKSPLTTKLSTDPEFNSIEAVVVE